MFNITHMNSHFFPYYIKPPFEWDYDSFLNLLIENIVSEDNISMLLDCIYNIETAIENCNVLKNRKLFPYFVGDLFSLMKKSGIGGYMSFFNSLLEEGIKKMKLQDDFYLRIDLLSPGFKTVMEYMKKKEVV